MKKTALTSEQLRQKLKLRHLEVKKRFSEKHPKVEKFFKAKGIEPGKIREHSAKILGAGALAGSLLLSPPSSVKALPSPQELISGFLPQSDKTKPHLTKDDLARAISSILPENPRPLTRQEEKVLESVFGQVTGIVARSSLEGEHLNTTYGYIGAEQHLRRYPGDTLSQHAPAESDSAGYSSGSILAAGTAPGLGAWGYFAPERESLTKQLEETEKWYAVVQTLYLPDWNRRQPHLKNWYKYRKVLIVNTENGKAVVAAVADSGPAAWTGKQFGGSPEVTDYLGGPKYKKGPVVVFFVDDPYNKVPLGPVEY